MWELREEQLLCCVTLGLVVFKTGCGNPKYKKVVVSGSGEEKGFQDSPDVPLCGLPIGFLD